MAQSPPRPLGRLGAVFMVLTLGLFACLAAACTSSHTPDRPAPPSAAHPVVVASFNFDESTLLAEIYAQALEHAGIPVRREFDLGPRELVWPALRQGLVDVVPEYLGTATVTAEASLRAEHASRGRLLADLRTALSRWGLTALEPARASDQNGFAVTRATARRYRLHTVSDLAPVAPHLVLGGPTECPQRPLCLIGLRRTYGVHFRRFEAFDDAAQRATALAEGVIDVEVTFTTDGQLATGSLVLLRDDKGLQPNESVVPVVSDHAVSRYGARLTHALDGVSAALDTRALRFLNWRVSVAGKDVRAEAHAWLQRHGLLVPVR